MRGASLLPIGFLFAVSAMAASIDLGSMDKSANPCEDFYQYACGTWIKKTELPPDRPIWSRGFDEVTLRNLTLLNKILEDYGKGKIEPDVPYAKQMGNLYVACMDEKGIEKKARGQFRDALGDIQNLKSVTQIGAVVGKMHMLDVNVFFGFGSDQDFKDPDQMIGSVGQGGMKLPNKDFYLSDKPEMKKIRAAYVDFAKSALKIAGYEAGEAQKQAEAILAFETTLANAALSPVDLRDPKKVYHRLERRGLIKLAPQFQWKEYFASFDEGDLQAINVQEPKFFSELNRVVAKMPMDLLKAYLTVHLFAAYADTMDSESVNVAFKLDQALLGMKELPPRWKRCVGATGKAMKMALSHAYVAKAFSEEGKKITNEMVRKIESAMKTKLDGLVWMDAPTKTAALEKLAAMRNFIAYPDKWRSYDGLELDRGSYLKSIMAARAFNNKYELNKIGKPVDRNEWEMPPYVVNAEFNTSLNALYFPAGIFQSPNFEIKRSQAANFGAIGTVMGHELTHGYDDEGRQFDQRGGLHDWWTKKTAAEFDRRAQCLAGQFDQYVVDGDVHLNGKLTLGENIADQGGLKLSYSAWKSTLTDKKNESGFTPDRVFFLAFAQVWCSKETPEFRRFLAQSNPHSLPHYRVIGTLSDNADFAAAFSCKPGDKMVPKNQCVVW